MRGYRTRALAVLGLSVLGLSGLGTAPICRAAEPPGGTSDSADNPAILQQRIDHARKELEKAARQLADLNTRMWSMETSGTRSREPMLGVLLGDAGDDTGIELAGVTPGGGAEQAGMKAGDRVVAVNGTRLDRGGNPKPLSLLGQAMSNVQAGDTVKVEYVRDGETRHAQVVTQERGQYMAKLMEQKKPWLQTLQSLPDLEDLAALKGLSALEAADAGGSGPQIRQIPAGLQLEDVSGALAGYFQVDRGVLVVRAPARSPGLEGGDILLAIGGQAVSGADGALETLGSAKGSVKVRVKRHGRIREEDLDADALNSEQTVQVTNGDRRIRVEQPAKDAGASDDSP